MEHQFIDASLGRDILRMQRRELWPKIDVKETVKIIMERKAFI